MKVGTPTEAKLVEIGETIRAARERVGISQAKLAETIEMQRENYIRVEKGRANVTVETLVRVAEGLGLDVKVTFVRRRSPG